jgi:hypothetical protein
VQLRFAQADPRFHSLSSTSLVLLGGGGLGAWCWLRPAPRVLLSYFRHTRERYATGDLLLHALHNEQSKPTKQLMSASADASSPCRLSPLLKLLLAFFRVKARYLLPESLFSHTHCNSSLPTLGENQKMQDIKGTVDFNYLLSLNYSL